MLRFAVRWLAVVLAVLVTTPALAQGKFDQYPAFASQYVQPRKVTVWTPDGYDGKTPLPVIYMQDNQQLWDPSTTWNGQSWDVANTMTRLIKSGQLPPAIVVGIDNGVMLRGREYLPQKIYDRLPAEVRKRTAKSWGGEPLSDPYLKFLVTELKPFIDSHYATKSDAQDTFILGSSMGGLIAFYAQAEYPDVFGASASLSMHWLLEYTGTPPDPKVHAPEVIQAFDDYLSSSRLTTEGRVYVDQGSQTLDANYRPYSLLFEAMMKRRGWPEGPHFSSQIFPGQDHSEKSWASRLDVALEFLLNRHVVASGSLITLHDVPSKFVKPRDVHVWLPDGYDPSAAQTYKVVYMMDGQNLFEPSPWSHADWGVADTLPGLIASGKVPPAIVVGVDNIDQRTAEYDPQRIYELLPPDYQARARDFAGGAAPNSDNFLRFLVTELKPAIDAAYKTRTGPDSTSIIGSSSGGHVALYAQGQYPKVFGASASLSMPWLMANPAKDDAGIHADVAVLTTAYRMWLKGTGMVPGRNRIYTDQGTVGLDALFTPYEESAVAMFRKEGWTDRDFAAPVYDGAEHSETFWRQRIAVPLQFVLGPAASPPAGANH